MTKDEIKAELDALKIDYDSTALKADLERILEEATTIVIRNKGV